MKRDVLEVETQQSSQLIPLISIKYAIFYIADQKYCNLLLKDTN